MSKSGTTAVKAILAKEDVAFFHDLVPAAEKVMETNEERSESIFAGIE